MAIQNLETVFLNAVNHHLNQQYEFAEDGYLLCLEGGYRLLDCLQNLGFLYTAIRDFQKAQYVYLQMLELKNDSLDTYLNLGSIYSELGSIDNGIKLYIKALEMNPHFVDIYNNLGILYKMQDRYEEALSTYTKGLLIAPHSEALHYNLSNLIRGRTLPLSYMKLNSTEVLLMGELEFEYNEFQDYTTPIFGYLFDKYGLSGCDFDTESGYRLLENPLFQLSLRKMISTNFYLENFLIKVRKEILKAILSGAYSNQTLDQMESFIYSLAIQCFWTEYVYAVDEEEANLLGQLECLLQNAFEQNDKRTLWYVGVYGCYKALALQSQSFIEHLNGAQVDAGEIFKEFYRIQLQEPLEEIRLKKTIPVLNPLNDEISRKVAHQYEENPYPRWISVKKLVANPLAALIKAQIPLIGVLEDDAIDKKEHAILIAGTGTGKHLIERAQQVSNAHVTGLDLSKASLAYAKRKATALNVNNIEFIQGNLLDVKLMGKQFNLIESVGVLHHMEDPMRGWKSLVDVLKPNGYMKIGLYSELARKSVIDTLSFVKERGYQAQLSDIRKCRNEIYHLDSSHTIWNLVDYFDFYSVSGTRDLIFNAQEHRFSIPQIDYAIQSLGLKFLGFSFANREIYKDYLDMFTEDKEGKNLKHWHEFEVKFPDTFIGMYQFWLQK